MIVDGTIVGMHQVCPEKMNLQIEQGWRPRYVEIAKNFGACLHQGLAVWYRAHDLAKALIAINESWPTNVAGGGDDYRTKAKCLEVMRDYAHWYPAENFSIIGAPDNPIIEKAFCLSTGMHAECISCVDGEISSAELSACANCGAELECIDYGGIFDGLIDFSGQVLVLDHKSTSKLGDYYFEQFRPHSSTTGYIWAAQQISGRKVQGALINAIGIYAKGETSFKRQITTRTADEINEWLRDLRSVCTQILRSRRSGRWEMRTSGCVTKYGRCEFHQVHQLGHAKEREKLLQQDYVVQPWDFLRQER